MLELHDICVSDAPVNFNLTHQFLFGPRPRNTGLLYYFGGLHVLGLLVHERVALGKAALSQEFAFYIAADCCLTAGLLKSFFNDGVLLLDGSHTAHPKFVFKFNFKVYHGVLGFRV